MQYKQLPIYLTAWDYRNYNEQFHKMNTYSGPKNILSEDGQRTEIKYQKT